MPSARSLTGLIKFIGRPEWATEMDAVLAEHLGPACNCHEIQPANIAEILDEGHAMTLWGCALEDFMARQLPGGANVVDDYIKRRGFQDSAGNKRYMLAIRRSVMSLYEVSDVVLGESFLARDLVRGGEPVRVFERSGSKQLKRWDRIAARLVHLGERWEMAGGVLMFDRTLSETLLEDLAEVMRRLPGEIRQSTFETFGHNVPREIEKALAGCDPLSLSGAMFTTIWLDNALGRVLNPRLPCLQNTDGHALVLCTLRFALAEGVKAADIRKALASNPDVHRETAKFFNWRRPIEQEPKQAPAPKPDGLTIMSTHASGETNLAGIEITKDAVIVSTNSRERSAAAQELIVRVLGDRVAGPPALEAVTAEEAIAAKADKPKPRKPKPIPPDEERAIIHAYLDQHYAKTLDEPVPALDNVSPRAAVKTAKGRAKVVDWLKGIENHMSHANDDAMAGYDTNWLWQELGLERTQV